MLFAVSCDKEIWDNNKGGNTEDIGGNGEESENDDRDIVDALPASPSFAIVDENDTLIEIQKSEIEFVFDGVTYTYNDETRALSPLPLGIYQGLSEYIFWIGHIYMYDNGVFTINFRDQQWEIEFDYEWGESGYIYDATYTLTIDGEPSERVLVDEVIDYYGKDEQQLLQITAHVLRFK